MTGGSAPRRWLRGHRRRQAALTLAALLVAAGVAWPVTARLGSDDAPSPRQVLEDRCGGAVPVDALLRLFGGEGPVWGHDVHGRDGRGCSFGWKNDEDPQLTVRFQDMDAREVTLPRSWAHVPLGDGWTGTLFRTNSRADRETFRKASASVLVGCGSDGYGTAGVLLVTVEAKAGATTFHDAASRRWLATVATGTARNAGRDIHCTRGLGGPVTEVGLPPTPDDYRDLDQATGTCAGVPDATDPARLGVRYLTEGPAARGLVEECVLRGWRGIGLYSLTASYGPYAVEPRITASGAATDPEVSARRRELGIRVLTAECSTGIGTAVYQIEPVPSTVEEEPELVPPHAELAAMLDAFARRSAQRHGCTVEGTG